MKYDVLVVGAGPSGSTAGYVLTKGGVRTLIVDVKRSPGVPVQCAEFVPIQLKHRFPEFFLENAIAWSVREMIHFTPWGEVVSMPSEGYVLNREVFDRRIVELAIQNGAELRLRTRFLGFEEGKVWLENVDRRKKYSVKVDVVIGADGPRSRVAKLTGEHTKSFLRASQFTMPLRVKLPNLLIFFRDYIPGGYGWVFPKGDVANVGVGIDPDYPISVMESMAKFIREVVSEGIVERDILRRTGGLIPAEGIRKPLRGKVLLVGDAGGFCHPITGGGIANAVYTGAMAAESILEGNPESYEEESTELLGRSINRAALKRIKYMKSWDDLRFIIPRTWIAFEEYWKEE